MTTGFLDVSRAVLAGTPGATETTSSGTPFWGDDPRAYDTVIFARNIRLPGNCDIEGKGFSQRVDSKKPAGSHGESTTPLGRNPAEITITCTMWMPEHLTAFAKLVPILRSQKMVAEKASNLLGEAGETQGFGGFESGIKGVGGFTRFSDSIKKRDGTRNVSKPAGPAPLDIYHPWLEIFRISSVHILEVGIPRRITGTDKWTVSIKCREFVRKREAQVVTHGKSLEIVESNPLVGKTAVTLENEKERKKPSRSQTTP